MITIFSTPKNFEGIYKIIQKNAFNSWRALSTDIEIIIFGDSKGTKEAAEMINAKYVPEVRCSPRGIPYLSDLFYKAGKISKYSILMFINADIILPDNFLSVVQITSRSFSKYLIVGHRWDMDVVDIVNFHDQKESEIFWKDAQKKSLKHACTGIDYFVFRKNTFNNLPDFAIGRPGYDNWLIWNARHSFIPVIDSSSKAMVVHQNHDFNFHNLKADPKIILEADGLMNLKIHQRRTLNLLDANYHFVNGKIEKKGSTKFINRNLGKLPIIFPEFSFLLILYKKFYRRVINNYFIKTKKVY